MKDIIIEAGRKLGKYLREELDGRVTLAHVKKICAIATDILPGERYEQARGLLSLCQKYHLLENYSESSFDRETRVKEITHTLVDRAMLAKSFALNAAALVVIICEGTPDAESFAKRVLEGETEKAVAPTPVPRESQPIQTTQPNRPTQPTPPPRPNNPTDFYIVNGVLKAYRGRDAHVVVPSNVKAIAGKAFADCRFLKSVVVPNSVKSIGSAAFTGCSSLESITLPFVGAEIKRSHDNYQKPFGFIFGTSNYEGAEYTKQWYYGYYEYTESVYYVPQSLKHVTITGGYMLDGAFYDCNNIVSIKFTPEEVTGLPAGMFFGCKSLETYDVPKNIKYIGRICFAYCYALDNIFIPEGITILSEGSIKYCDNLKNITLPSSLKIIADGALQNCRGLVELTIPDGVTEIGEYAFYYCDNLERVTIPKSVKKIGDGAFENCEKLTIYKAGGLNIFEKIFGTKWNPNKRPVEKV